MRKAQKQALLDFVKNFQQAHEEIQEAIFRKNYVSARKMLAECQEFAISLGEIIESTEGEGHRSVFCLEEYCEALFRVHQEIDGICDDGESSINENRISGMLRKYILQLENSIRNDITSKKEVVFLPYKASMWDSMESVWKAAIGDERCDAYVVPIPYFDRKPDGTFGEMHYEGEEYLEDVPVVFWKDFLVEEHRPDIIYIHNPYDQYNYVTSVHPDFYASRLRSYTDKLVYIPYFSALNGEVPKHFVTLPGVLYAHKVIVQSERARQIYIEELHEFEKQNHCENFYGKPEEKILALGSPKYDKVLTTKREDISIPLEWQRIINGQGLT